MIGVIFSLSALVLVIGIVVISIGVGIGYILTLIIPGVEIGLAVVAGAIFSVGILGFSGKILSTLNLDSYSDTFADDEFDFDPNETIKLPPKSWSTSKSQKRKRRKNKVN